MYIYVIYIYIYSLRVDIYSFCLVRYFSLFFTDWALVLCFGLGEGSFSTLPIFHVGGSLPE